MKRVWLAVDGDNGIVMLDDFTDQGESVTGIISRQSAIELVAMALNCAVEYNISRRNTYELY